MSASPAPAKGAGRTVWPLLAGLSVILLIVGVTIASRGRSMPAGDSIAPAPAMQAPATRAAEPARGPRASVQISMAERRERRKAMQAEQERKGRAFHAALAERYASEPVDAAWASAKEAKLLAASVSDEIRRVDAVPGNYRASCHSSVCKVSADFPNRGAVQDWLTLFSTGVGGELPNESYVVSQNPDGGFHLEIMGLARK